MKRAQDLSWHAVVRRGANVRARFTIGSPTTGNTSGSQLRVVG